jgi:tRNA(fMet)-specific endonuclease VapC
VTDPLFLLDSNIIIYLLEGLSDSARERIEQCRPGEVATSAVAYAEVMRGIALDDIVARRKVEAFFSIVKILPFDTEAALCYTRVPFKRGHFDRLIAAHAIATNLTVITNNSADFADVPGLKFENWTTA